MVKRLTSVEKYYWYKEHEEEIEKIFQECLREWLEECINKFVDIKDMRLKN